MTIDFRLKPYVSIDGIPTMTDSYIMNLHKQLVAEGLDSTVFYDGEILTEWDFLNMMKFGRNSLFVVEVLPGETPGGFVWLNNFDRRKAEFHFAFFCDIRGNNAVDIGKSCMFDLLNMDNGNGYIFDVFTGLVPSFNVPANKWCDAIGVTYLGEIPNGIYHAESGKSESGMVYYAVRGEYGEKGR